MTLVALKGLLAHKVRVLMTALSIALGVAFVGGTLVLTDSLTGSFSQSFRHQYEGVDVAVRSAASVEAGGVGDQRLPVPADLLETVRDLPAVEAAAGSVTGYALMVDGDGKTVGAGAQSNNGMSAPTSSIGGAVTYSSGRAPSGSDEVAVDAGSVAQASLEVGDRIRVLFRGPPREFTVVGVARFGDQDRLGSTTTALFDLSTAQEVLGKTGTYDEIRVAGTDGLSADDLRDRIAGALPAGIEAVTGQAVADERAAALEDDLGFISTFLLVFAAIAVFVGSFIIWNTFSILVAQRTRELALLRAIGATRRQVRRSVLVEAGVVGVVASIVGVALGVGLARLLVVLLGQTGVEMTAPSIGDLTARTVLISVAVGVVITVLAAVAPARKATRVAPVEALRESVPGGYRFSLRRAVVGGVVLALGASALGAGLFGGAGVELVGIGVLVTFLGVTTLLPLLSRVLARGLGAPLPVLAGTTGQLARDNAMRNPKRTAATAAALMIGLAMVATITVLAQSLKVSIGSDVERTITSELVLQAAGQGALTPDVARAVRGTDGVQVVSEVAWGEMTVDGAVNGVSPVDPATIGEVIDLGVADGELASMSSGKVVVHEGVAEEKGWQVGDVIDVEWPQSGAGTLEIGGVFTEKDAVSADYLVSLETYDANVAGRLDAMVLLRTEPGADVAAVQAAVTDAVAPYADTQVLTADELTESIAGEVDQFLLMVTALLMLAVVIALMGIVNTLALSVFERTREIGLLRAVGMTRSQVRRMVRWESVVIAGIGAVTGSAVGLVFGVALVTALDDEGVSQLSVPWSRLGVYVLAAAVAGVVAALGPARRASNVDVLTAVKTD